jgi:lipid II:glycine glycyltransferase (peptidoglycan interpeptide bridge formation enzyme)
LGARRAKTRAIRSATPRSTTLAGPTGCRAGTALPEPTGGTRLVGRVEDAPGPDRLRAWDELVRSVPLSDVTQLSAWARLREQAGYHPLYVFVEKGDHLAGGAQILMRQVAGLGPVAYLSNGPLVSPVVGEPASAHDTLADAIAHLGRTRFRLFFVQPPDGATHTSEALLRRGFRPSDAGIAPTASLRLDLSVDEDELRRNLSKSLRQWTNRWESHGVAVRPSTAEDLPLLAELLAATSWRQGSTPLFGTAYLAVMHRELAGSGHLVGFIGEAAGRPVAMLLLTGCGGVLRGRFVGFSPSEEARRLNVPAAVDWTAIRWAKANGYRWYDFGGVRDQSLPLLLSRDLRNFDALPGPDRYKARFGGQLCHYPAPVELIRPAALRLTYELARRTTAGRAIVTHAKRLLRTGATARPPGD